MARNAYKVFVEKPKGKAPLDKPWRRRETIINMNLKYVHCEDVDLTYVARDRSKWQDFVSKLMYLQVREMFSISSGTGSFSKGFVLHGVNLKVTDCTQIMSVFLPIKWSVLYFVALVSHPILTSLTGIEYHFT
jgi:hypothetical protein